MSKGALVISLDFEIHWGVSDRRSIDSYRKNLENVPGIVRRTLQMFTAYQVHGTWATVGMLFCRSKSEIFSLVPPAFRPTYLNTNCSNFLVAEQAGENETDDPFHYAPSLIQLIQQTPGQEIGTHTYSHYYCLEPGQTAEQFNYDLRAARTIATEYGIELNSIVFPANQFRPDYLAECAAQGIKVYRGNYPSRIYAFNAKAKEGLTKRLARLIDNYIPLLGNRYADPKMDGPLMNVPASCFLRPYSHRLRHLEPLRLRRIKKEMTAAAKNGRHYHLWWHPHNFGGNPDANFRVLNKILQHYTHLREQYGMESLTMNEVYERR